MELKPASDIMNLIRESSRTRLQAFLNLDVASEKIKKSELVYQPWMVLILVGGNLLRVSIKVHFKMEQVKLLASELYGLSPETMTEENAFDFVREFSNLIAGAVKTDLGNHEVAMEVSLPVGTRGWEEFFFSIEESDVDVTDAWGLVSSKGRIEVSASVERLTSQW